MQATMTDPEAADLEAALTDLDRAAQDVTDRQMALERAKDTRDALIVRLRANGVGLRAIGRRVGLTHAAVLKIIARAGTGR